MKTVNVSNSRQKMMYISSTVTQVKKKKSKKGKLHLNVQKYNFICAWNLLGEAVMFAEPSSVKQ